MWKFDYDVPEGTTIHFYKGGDLASKPLPGFATAINKDGVADITLIPRGGGSHMPAADCVHFHLDPWCKEHPDVVRNEGVWDFMPPVERKKAVDKK